MAKKQPTRQPRTFKTASPHRSGVTPERFTRLYKLLHLLGSSSRTRDWLMAQLQLDVRGFYRDLELLRAAGIAIQLLDGEYSLGEKVTESVARLPFPDPHLTFGEVRQLAKGRSALHQRLQEQVQKLIS